MAPPLRTVVLAALALAGTGAVDACQSRPETPTGTARTFQTGVIGSAPSGRGNPSAALSDATVRALILEIAEGAVSTEGARARLSGSAYSLPDLETLGLVTAREGRAFLAFNYLSAADQRLIAARARAYARELADRILTSRDALQLAVAPLAATPDERRRVLFFLVGCVALDWDGLDVTAERGYRVAATVAGEGFAYTPWMKENASDISRKGLYWGSHNTGAGEFTFTTFGDHQALPRRALPDVTFGREIPFALPELARTLLAVEDGAGTEEAVAMATGLPESDAMIAFLRDLGYLQDVSGRLSTGIPILSRRASAATAEIRRLIRADVAAWHAARYSHVAAELADLTPLRHGVPFAAVYSEIWHYIFGYANLYLAEAGVLADPYAPGERFQGFVPVLWWSGLRAVR